MLWFLSPDLVKYDKNTASIEIAIKNGGRDAYKPDVFGNLIVVERKIQKEGAGGYKIRGKSG